MALLIPREYKKDLSERSGFLKHGSKFAQKNLKGLFMAPENMEYLGRQLFTLTTLPARIAEILNTGLSKADYTGSEAKGGAGAKRDGWGTGTFVDGKFAPNGNYAPEAIRLARELKKHRSTIIDMIPNFIEDYGSKFYTNDFYEEDYATNSPVMQLHHLNKKFLLETSAVIIQSPNILIANYFDVNPDTGVEETAEWDFSARSYADGTWHPEDLFTNNKRNRENPHWVPMEITFDSNPPRSRERPLHDQGFSPFSQNRATRKEDMKGLTYHHREGYESFKNEPGGTQYGDVLTGGNMDRGDYGIDGQEFSYDPLLDDPM
jgi:hypothetical protein